MNKGKSMKKNNPPKTPLIKEEIVNKTNTQESNLKTDKSLNNPNDTACNDLISDYYRQLQLDKEREDFTIISDIEWLII